MGTKPFVIGPGTMLSRFRIIEKLGSGGMGQVYRARDEALGRDVAIKVLPPDAVGTPERRRRFETEAKVVATLSDPGIVPVYDIGECGGTPFIVQELVAGDTVDDLIRKNGALPIDKVAEWGIQAADALAKAHDAGILHRDVKPRNLIVGTDGRLRVFDFGLAKILERPGLATETDRPLTTEGMIVGTVHYMSPEQAQGQGVDARSDIFSLGIVLYEMATGRRPFGGESAVDVMHKIVHAPAAPIDSALTALPAAFVAILEKALEKRPDERYQSILDMSADLKRYLRRKRNSSAPWPLAREASPAVAFGPSRPRWKRPVLAASIVALAAIGGGLALGGRRKTTPMPPAATRAFLQSDCREEDPVFSPDGHGFAYSSNEGGEYEIYYRLFASSSPIRLTQPWGQKRHPAFSADGGTILFSFVDPLTQESSILAVPVLGGPVRRILERGEQPHVSRDGRRLLFIRQTGSKSALVVANADGTFQKTVVETEIGQVTGARFSNDGTFIAYLKWERTPSIAGDVWRVKTEGGTPVRLTHDNVDVWGHVEFLPDDSAVMFSSFRSGSGTIWMVPSEGGDPVQVVPASSILLSPSISPDGRSLLVQSRRWVSDAWEFSLADGHGRQLTNCGSVWSPARLLDGRLLYGDWIRSRASLEIFLEDPAGNRTLLTEGGTPRPSADGRKAYFSTNLPSGRRGIAVVEVSGGPPRILTDDSLALDDWPDPTPDGESVVFVRSSREGKESLCRVEASTGNVKALYEGHVVSPRATLDNVVFRTCAHDDACGIYLLPLSGGVPRLIVPNGWYPAVSRDGKTVYAWVGQKSDPYAVSVPIDGSAPPKRLFAFNAEREVQFWAVHTLDVSPDGRFLIATRQWMNDDILLLEGVFR